MTTKRDLPKADAIAKLSARERSIFHGIGEGLTTAEIAARFGIRHSTVETYRERIKTKLNLPNGAILARDAAIWWYLNSN
jgi:DNA-binding NarL/FixJ family response regulator